MEKKELRFVYIYIYKSVAGIIPIRVENVSAAQTGNIK